MDVHRGYSPAFQKINEFMQAVKIGLNGTFAIILNGKLMFVLFYYLIFIHFTLTFYRV